MYKLEPPYTTKCQKYSKKGYRDSFQCVSECINQHVLKNFKKASLSHHYFKGVDYKFLSNKEFKNKTFVSQYRKILNECIKTCPLNDCHFIATYTTTIGEAFTAPAVEIQMPDKPSFVIKYTVTVSFIDTVNFICSVLGLWFGFSFMTIHPDRMYQYSEKRKIRKSSLNITIENLVPSLVSKFDSIAQSLEYKQRQINILRLRLSSEKR